MKILFLDQSGELGGAELCLLDIVKMYRDRALVCLFANGSFAELLQQQQIPVQVLEQSISVRKHSHLIQSLSSLQQLIPLGRKIAKLAQQFDLIYANTQKALVVGAIASFFSRRPLVYHLHDILSRQHFSSTNLHLAVALANRFAAAAIANSQATKNAFIAAGGQADKIQVIYNGFVPENFNYWRLNIAEIRQQWELNGKFIVGSFSRLSPWKGQHILLEALAQCPSEVSAIFAGEALFGEQDYAAYLQHKVVELGLKNRVRFLGFCPAIAPLMAACDAVVHTSTAAEPFGRVIVEAMLCQKPAIATRGGGASEIITDGVNGLLVSPGEPQQLAAAIATYYRQPEKASAIAQTASKQASDRFHLANTNQQIDQLLQQIINKK